MTKKQKRTSRAPIPDDIERELRNARHYQQLLTAHERAAQEAEMTDAAAPQAAKEAFLRDHSACLNAARSAKNYLMGGMDASGHRAWLDERLAPPTYKFHADVAGSIFHDGSIMLSRSVGVRVEIKKGSASFEVVQTLGGSFSLEPRTGDVTKVPMRYIYNADDLGPVLAPLLGAMGSGARAILDLLDEYIGGLEQAAKSAVRNGRF